MDLEITDREIELAEQVLLPTKAHFPEDAREVIRRWQSFDVAACPGSGKTTVLLAKLKILADRMPFENNAGVCVLSHTNVAVNEIKRRLSNYADKLLSYPNHIGTIQSFIDNYVTMPYLRRTFGVRPQTVDDTTYAQHVLNRIKNSKRYSALNYLIDQNYKMQKSYHRWDDYIKGLFIREDGALCLHKQKKALAGAGKKSTEQFKLLIRDILINEGIIRYQDAYYYATDAIKELSTSYSSLFSLRFKYVFVDEYQDCNAIQRGAIDELFNADRCALIKIGDPDQAIYNSIERDLQDWTPQKNFVVIQGTNRCNQEVANVISKLRKSKEKIISLSIEPKVKPVILTFDADTISRVVSGFVEQLELHGLHDKNGCYKAIGAIKNPNTAGLTIGSYWSGYDGTDKEQRDNNYWAFIDRICEELSDGKLYKAERIVRGLICSMFNYVGIKNLETGKKHTITTLKKKLDEQYKDIYRQWLFEISSVQDLDRQSADSLIRQLIKQLFAQIKPQLDLYDFLPDFFLKEPIEEAHNSESKGNIYIDPIRGRRIEFNTIHGVKGETHDATLYLETDRRGTSDLNRILPYYGVGRIGDSALYDYSRKLAYVGMSRPKKLLCVAMRAQTFEKSKEAFVADWTIVDLRNKQ